MADMGLYRNIIEHARIMENITYNRRSKSLRNIELAFEMPDSEFVGLYRLSKSVCRDLIQELEPYIASRREGISVMTKVLSALSFYASGSYQRFIGASAHNKMHQVSVSNCIRAVTKALNNEHFRRKYIHFPLTRQERLNIIQGFYQKYDFPGVLGCIDCTHVAIVKPAHYEDRYFNRKHYHSINVQIVSDAELNIMSVDASHGGANHDSFIWNYHPLRRHLEQLHSENETLWLLGDSGYALRPTMLTPILDTEYVSGDSGYALRPTMLTPILDTESGSPQRHYTDLHCHVRNSVERCIGVLKSRWRCLLIHRKLHYDPTTAGLITNACVVLHNIANSARLPVIDLSPHEHQIEVNMQAINLFHHEARNHLLADGERVRSGLIERLWSTRH